MRKNDTQEAFQTFLQYGQSGQREMNAEDLGSATKKDVSLSKIHNQKDIIKGDLFTQKWLSGQYASKALKITSHRIYQNE